MLVTQGQQMADQGEISDPAMQQMAGTEEPEHPRSVGKPSLAERNRERQQRFRQRQKTRIEELETQNFRLTQLNRELSEDKETCLKNLNFFKDLVHQRECQLVTQCHRLSQLLPEGERAEERIVDIASADNFLKQQAIAEFQNSMGGVMPTAEQAQVLKLTVPMDPARLSADPEQRARNSSEPGLIVAKPVQNNLGLDQLCRVAELAELQRDNDSQAAPDMRADPAGNDAADSTFPFISDEFAKFTDVAINVEGQKILLHSSILAASSNYYAKKFAELKHSQPLFDDGKEHMPVDTASPGKRLQDVQAFLRHCYRSLDVRAVRNADLMRLIMLADEFDSKSLVEECDQLLVERSDRKPFTYFIELSNGGDMVDWLRLTDSVGLKKAGSICEMHLARHLKENPGGQESARMHELGQDCLLRVINKLAQI